VEPTPPPPPRLVQQSKYNIKNVIIQLAEKKYTDTVVTIWCSNETVSRELKNTSSRQFFKKIFFVHKQSLRRKLNFNSSSVGLR
jgi:hypothetical protein